MGQNQDFNQVLVSNVGTIPSTGTTVNLAYGQIGIFDAETYLATNAPTYLANKGLIFAQGVKDLSGMPNGAGIANETEKTKTVLGKRILSWRGKKAKTGQTMKVAIGYDGVDNTKTISAKPGDIKYLYLRLTGKPIENLYPGGKILYYQYQEPCIDGCTDNGCTDINPLIIAENLRKQISEDFLMANNPLKDYVKVSVMSDCTTPPPDATLVPFDTYNLTIQDDGSDYSLGLVQAQAPGTRIKPIERVERFGITSVYTVTVPDGAAAPTAFTNAGAAAITDCAVCPTGYTLTPSLKVFQVNQPAATAAPTGLPGQQGAAVLVANNYGYKVYEVFVSLTQADAAFITAVAAINGAEATLLGVRANVCILTTPTTTAWVAGAGCNKAQKTYKLSMRDDECGTSFLAQMQAIYNPIYGAGSVTEVENNAEYCTRLYNLTITSDDCLAADCEDISWDYTDPEPFKGVSWEVIVPEDTSEGCVAGLLFESAFVGRQENKCYFDIFPYEVDGVHIEVSNHSPDWHGSVCEEDWPVTVVQEFEYPAGNGQFVARQELKSRGYHFKGYPDARFLAERLAEGADIVTDLNRYYDQYSLVFEFKYSVGGWSETYTDTYQVDFYYPTGQGKAFEAAMNTYLSAAQIAIDPVVL